MSNEIQEIIPIPENKTDLTIARAPEIVLAEAQKAAKALQDVIANKKNPFMLHGEQYIEYDDWQLIGKFYGVTAKVKATIPLTVGAVEGWEAKAVVVRLSDGIEISGAEAMCLNDEPNWRSKPMFQLRSMAQTRACAKALRNVLAWVVMLAGYKTTPAEEMPLESNPSAPGGHPGVASDLKNRPFPKHPSEAASKMVAEALELAMIMHNNNVQESEEYLLKLTEFKGSSGEIVRATFPQLRSNLKWSSKLFKMVQEDHSKWMRNEIPVIEKIADTIEPKENDYGIE